MSLYGIHDMHSYRHILFREKANKDVRVERNEVVMERKQEMSGCEKNDADGHTVLREEKIGIMGGTFNPIHMGHLLLAEWAKEEMALDRILFVPTGCSYMKRASGTLNAAERLYMTRLAVAGREDFSVSDVEEKRSGPTYTSETLLELKSRLPEAKFYFIMGADCLFSIENWHKPEEIFQNCTVIAAARNGASMEHMEEKCEEFRRRFGSDIRLLQFPRVEISSTDIRQRVAEGKSIRYMVPEKVEEYILQKGLYRKYESRSEDCGKV